MLVQPRGYSPVPYHSATLTDVGKLFDGVRCTRWRLAHTITTRTAVLQQTWWSPARRRSGLPQPCWEERGTTNYRTKQCKPDSNRHLSLRGEYPIPVRRLHRSKAGTGIRCDLTRKTLVHTYPFKQPRQDLNLRFHLRGWRPHQLYHPKRVDAPTRRLGRCHYCTSEM